MRALRSPACALVGVVLFGGVVLLGGCTSDSPEGSGTGSVTASVSPSAASPSASGTPAPSPSWSGTETLSPEQLQAFEEATQTVLAYRQTIVDLYSGARENLNDLNLVATGDLLDDDLQGVQKGLVAGRRVVPADAQLRMVGGSPESVDLDGDVDRVVVKVCVDATPVTTVEPDGSEVPGVVESLEYTIVRTAHLPEPGWAVSRVRGASDPSDRQC